MAFFFLNRESFNLMHACVLLKHGNISGLNESYSILKNVPKFATGQPVTSAGLHFPNKRCCQCQKIKLKFYRVHVVTVSEMA